MAELFVSQILARLLCHKSKSVDGAAARSLQDRGSRTGTGWCFSSSENRFIRIHIQRLKTFVEIVRKWMKNFLGSNDKPPINSSRFMLKVSDLKNKRKQVLVFNFLTRHSLLDPNDRVSCTTKRSSFQPSQPYLNLKGHQPSRL